MKRDVVDTDMDATLPQRELAKSTSVLGTSQVDSPPDIAPMDTSISRAATGLGKRILSLREQPGYIHRHTRARRGGRERRSPPTPRCCWAKERKQKQ